MKLELDKFESGLVALAVEQYCKAHGKKKDD